MFCEKKEDALRFLRERGVELDTRSPNELKTEARNLGLPDSHLRTIDELQNAIKRVKLEKRRLVPAPRTKKRTPPVPAPRRRTRKRNLMDQPVPEMTAQILVPQRIPLRPPRIKAFEESSKGKNRNFFRMVGLVEEFR